MNKNEEKEIVTVRIEKSVLKEVIAILRACAWNDPSKCGIYNKIENLQPIEAQTPPIIPQ